MEVKVLQPELRKALSAAAGASARTSPLEVLSFFLLTAVDGEFRVAATDLSLSISVKVPAQVTREGAIAVPVQLLSQYVGALPSDVIELEVVKDNLEAVCGAHRSKLKGLPGTEFPELVSAVQLKELEGSTTWNVNTQTFLTMVRQVAHAAATEESRPILTGVYMTVKDDKLVLVTADGFRLNVATGGEVPEDFGLIVPARALKQLAKIAGKEEVEIEMVTDKARNRVLFAMPNVQVYSQVLTGSYPDYEQIVPTAHAFQFTYEREALLKAVKVAGLWARQSSGIIQLVIGNDGKLNVEAAAAESGDTTTELEPLEAEGEALTFAINYRYFQDTLNAITTAGVTLQGVSASKPIVCLPKWDEDEEYDCDLLSLIMPMHITT